MCFSFLMEGAGKGSSSCPVKFLQLSKQYCLFPTQVYLSTRASDTVDLKLNAEFVEMSICHYAVPAGLTIKPL
jgi:hypothetical protein